MKKLAIGIALVAASIATPGLAADMPTKAVPYVPATYNWSGIYGGASIGWVHEDETWTYTNPVPATPPTSSAHDINADDAIFGGHIGLQYQFQQIVVGVEAAASRPTSSKFTASGLQCVNVAGSLCEARAQALYTVGGRLGYAWNRWLVFASGGWAQLEIDTQELTLPPSVFDFSTTHRHDGYYVGGGVEYALTDHLILGLEYQHVAVDTVYHASSGDAFAPSPPGVNGRNIDGTEDIVRARLSVKFGIPGVLGTN
jgi:outer membrane immunogenic protein